MGRCLTEWRYVIDSWIYYYLVKILTIAFTAGKLPCHVHQIHNLRNTFFERTRHLVFFPRHVSRPVHTNPLHLLPRLQRHNPRTQTLSTSNTLPCGTPHLPRLSRAHGRYHRSPHHPLPTRLPLRLSPKMARLRLSRLPPHTTHKLAKHALRAHRGDSRPQSVPSLRLSRGLVDLLDLRERGVREVQGRAREGALEGDGA